MEGEKNAPLDLAILPATVPVGHGRDISPLLLGSVCLSLHSCLHLLIALLIYLKS
jgi:hypothetical protein